MANHRIELDININVNENGVVTQSVNSKDIKPLSEYSIGEIKDICKAGKHKEYFRIGDKFDINLGDDILTMAIAGFDMDKDADGNIVPITFTAVNVLKQECPMTKMDEYLSDLFAKFPKDLQEAIVPIKKGKKVYRLFLHSEKEIFGKTIYSKDNTGEQYPYYKEKCHRCKFKNDEDNTSWWWERSAHYSGSSLFCRVNDCGGASFSYALYSYGVAPAFGI